MNAGTMVIRAAKRSAIEQVVVVKVRPANEGS